MAGVNSGTGTAGNSFTHYSYPAVAYGNNDFHHCGNGNDDDIKNYNDAHDVQFCELSNLAE